MLDIDTRVAGAETKVTRHTGCKPGGSVESWEMIGSGHYLFTTDEFRRVVATLLPSEAIGDPRSDTGWPAKTRRGVIQPSARLRSQK
jgi:hypothetical protein